MVAAIEAGRVESIYVVHISRLTRDQTLIDGAVNGAGTASKGIGSELRRMQSGNIRSYAAWVAIGGAAVIAYMIWKGVGK